MTQINSYGFTSITEDEQIAYLRQCKNVSPTSHLKALKFEALSEVAKHNRMALLKELISDSPIKKPKETDDEYVDSALDEEEMTSPLIRDGWGLSYEDILSTDTLISATKYGSVDVLSHLREIYELSAQDMTPHQKFLVMYCINNSECSDKTKQKVLCEWRKWGIATQLNKDVQSRLRHFSN